MFLLLLWLLIGLHCVGDFLGRFIVLWLVISMEQGGSTDLGSSGTGCIAATASAGDIRRMLEDYVAWAVGGEPGAAGPVAPGTP